MQPQRGMGNTMNFDLVPRARACRRGFRGAAACPCAAAAAAAGSAAASAAKSLLLAARGPAPGLRPRRQRRGPRRTAPQVRGGRRQPAGRDRPAGDGSAAGGLREKQLLRPVQRQPGGSAARSTRKIQQMRDNLDRIQADMERLRGDPGARARGSAPRHPGGAGAEQLRPAVSAAGGGGAAAAQRRNLFESLFGPRSVFTPGSGGSRTRLRRRRRAAPSAPSACAPATASFTRFQPPPIRAALPRTKRPAASPARPPMCSCTRTAIRARTSTRRFRSAASSRTRRCRMRSAIARPSIRAAVAGARAKSWSQALKNVEDPTVEQGDIVVNDQRARQMSQPRVDAQGKPIRQAPVAPPKPDPKAAPHPSPAASPAAAPAPAASAAPADDGPSKPDPNRTVRAVGPVFIPSTR